MSQDSNEQSDGASLRDEIRRRYTGQFRWGVVLFVISFSAAFVFISPEALLVATLLAVFVAFGAIFGPDTVSDTIQCEYTATPEHPRIGEPVSVTLTVTNSSNQSLSDIRIQGATPQNMAVKSGSAKTGGVLRPGESLETEYSYIARRGVMEFDHVTVQKRGTLGGDRLDETVETDESATVRCAVTEGDIPIEAEATNYLGDLLAESGGDGIQFHSTREYNRGDKISRINWRALAKQKELTTITYREQMAADIAICLDVRAVSRISDGSGRPTAAMLCMYAGYQLAGSLSNEGHNVGVCALGIGSDRSLGAHHSFEWIDYSTPNTERFVFQLFDEVDSQTEEPSDATPALDWTAAPTLQTNGEDRFPINNRLDGDEHISQADLVPFFSTIESDSAQEKVIYISPFHDAFSRALCHELVQRNKLTAIISPDMLGTGASNGPTTFGYDQEPSKVLRQIARAKRATFIENMRNSGETIIDWDPTKSLAVCCERQIITR